jgi:acetylornithine deacetylase/succinyl-diaminopimelate desuccinylase-like protein
MYLSKRFENLPPDKKRRARFQLYFPIFLIVAGLISLAWVLGRAGRLERDQTWTEVDYASLPEVQLLQDYVRVDTSPTTGSELAGAQFLAERLRRLGLEPHIEDFGDGRANLWAVLEGEKPEALVLHSHIDVSPAEQSAGWEHPPYDAVIDKAWIYGRGTFDMKSVAVAQLLALEDLIESGRKPKMSVIFLATGSEESGSHLGTSWILQNHPELADRFALVLTEGGVIEPISMDEIKYWGIEFAQKWFSEGTICSSDRSQLEAISETLKELSESNHELGVTDEVKSFLSSYSGSREKVEYRRMMDDTQEILNHPGSFDQLPKYIRSLFREELMVFPVEEDPNGGYRIPIFLHLFPSSDLEDVRRRLLPEWATHGATVSLRQPQGTGEGSPLDHPAFEIMVDVVRERFPEARVGPHFLVWSATDSRFFRQVGIPSFGFSPFPIFATDTYRHDAANERLGLPGYVTGSEIYRDVVQRLAN